MWKGTGNLNRFRRKRAPGIKSARLLGFSQLTGSN